MKQRRDSHFVHCIRTCEVKVCTYAPRKFRDGGAKVTVYSVKKVIPG